MVANSNYYHPVVSDMHRVKKHLKGAICTLNSIHHILQRSHLLGIGVILRFASEQGKHCQS